MSAPYIIHIGSGRVIILYFNVYKRRPRKGASLTVHDDRRHNVSLDYVRLLFLLLLAKPSPLALYRLPALKSPASLLQLVFIPPLRPPHLPPLNLI